MFPSDVSVRRNLITEFENQANKSQLQNVTDTFVFLCAMLVAQITNSESILIYLREFTSNNFTGICSLLLRFLLRLQCIVSHISLIYN